jgi:predicted  nucleic acid-binding Zn-ribbon protein
MSDSSPLAPLLDVQAHDTHLDQLRHQRETLPARDALAKAEKELARLGEERSRLEVERGVFTTSQRRIEDEVAGLEEKANEVHATLYSGTITSPRELQDLQAELDSLRRRQSQLEDEIIELMEQGEPLDAQLADLDTQGAALESEVNAVRTELTTAEAELDVVIARELGERAALAQGLDEQLLAEYERLRAALGGIGVARFEGGRCLGCQLMLSAVERDRLKGLAPDSLVHCEECGRLLVR